MADSNENEEFIDIDPKDLDRMLDVKIQLTVELGRRRVKVAEVINMGPGSVVEFPKSADEPLDIRVNDQLVARGEAVVIGERYGIRVTEVISPNERLKSSGLVKEVDPLCRETETDSIADSHGDRMLLEPMHGSKDDVGGQRWR